jgi:hypothetical protein
MAESLFAGELELRRVAVSRSDLEYSTVNMPILIEIIDANS